MLRQEDLKIKQKIERNQKPLLMQTVHRSRSTGSKACSMSWPSSRRHSNPQCWMRTKMCRVPAWRKEMKIERGIDEYPLVQLFANIVSRFGADFVECSPKFRPKIGAPLLHFCTRKVSRIDAPLISFPQNFAPPNWGLFRMINFDTITKAVSTTILSHPNICPPPALRKVFAIHSALHPRVGHCTKHCPCWCQCQRIAWDASATSK